MWDIPAEAMEFFGSFIAMDDPRPPAKGHRGPRNFTPRLPPAACSARSSGLRRSHRRFLRNGEADLVQSLSAPFPLLVICDMMGIPRSEYQTVLDATNIILGGRATRKPPVGVMADCLLDAGLSADRADERVGRPTSRPSRRRSDQCSGRTATWGRTCWLRDELAAFFILLAVAGTTPPAPQSAWACICSVKIPASGPPGRPIRSS